MEKKYSILVFYCYTEITDPQREVKRHQKFLKTLDVRCRIYIAKNGINAQMSLLSSDVDPYLNWLREDPRFEGAMFQIDPYHEHTFPRVAVKFREQLVALNAAADLKKRGTHVPPEEWKKMLENRDEKTLLIDVRNDYESEIGHFEGADRPPLKNFRDFPRYADDLAKANDPKKTKVMMYCTGGIRCETYSALLKEKGFEEVYQLQGGVINYGHKIGNEHWRGKLFVFDDRLSTPICEKEHDLISHCHFCKAMSDTYYNCANMDCNELFLCCLKCGEKMQGCCSRSCAEAPRRRPFVKEERPKPFRKWYHYSASKSKVVEEGECGCGG